ncbi:peptide deformylase [Endozoicomonas arenosclerae]|uniref:peptide deformylase n=1 Tax=Endozoicomonas arenosclerae TaxID=1633495 RepID=UPI0007849C9F|nr:peptide deformylase [Endozoicomonas arenosclerae]
MRLNENPEVLLMGHPLLFQEQPQVVVGDIASDDFQHNLEILKQKQVSTQGVGLAAPQLGWSARVLSVGISEINRSRYPQAPDIPFQFWINPQISDFSQTTCWTWEACLSVPGMRAWIERPESITVAGYNELGERQEKALTGFPARVMQHELDHLNGKLFPMRVEDKSLIIPNLSIEHQESWAEGWPTENAHKTPRGQISQHR